MAGYSSLLIPCYTQLFFGVIMTIAFATMLGIEMEFLTRGYRYNGKFEGADDEVTVLTVLEPALIQKTPLRSLSHLPYLIPAIVVVSG